MNIKSPYKPKIHKLKTWPLYFDSIAIGTKNFEVRKNDRNYQVNDCLRLEEYDPVKKDYTGMWVMRRITYILEGGKFGIEKGYVVLGLVKDNPVEKKYIDETRNLKN